MKHAWIIPLFAAISLVFAGCEQKKETPKQNGQNGIELIEETEEVFEFDEPGPAEKMGQQIDRTVQQGQQKLQQFKEGPAEKYGEKIDTQYQKAKEYFNENEKSNGQNQK